MIEKICVICKESFLAKGKSKTCSLECRKENERIGNNKRNKKYLNNNKDKIKKQCAKYRKKNKDKIKERRNKRNFLPKIEIKIYTKICLICDSNFESKSSCAQLCSKECKLQRKKNRKNEFYKNTKNDPDRKLRKIITSSMTSGFKFSGLSKAGKSIIGLIGYSIDEGKKYITSLFEDWMTWENHGTYIKNEWDDNDPSTWRWQLDHIIPQSTFDFHDEEEIKKAWALSNLRPLSAKQNVIDGARGIKGKKKIKN